MHAAGGGPQHCLPELPRPELQLSPTPLSSGLAGTSPDLGPWGGCHGNDALLKGSMSGRHRAGCAHLPPLIPKVI